MRLSADALKRLRWILYYVDQHGTIAETCTRFGITRGTFHRWMKRFSPENLSALEERPHGAHAVRQSTVPAETVDVIRSYRKAQPMLGKERIAQLLIAEHGVTLSSSTIARVIERECMFFGDTPLHWKKRLEEQRRTEPIIASAAHVGAHAGMDAVFPDASIPGWLLWIIRWNWKRIRRSGALALVVCNIAFLALVIGTLLWEREKFVPDAPLEVTLDTTPDRTLHGAAPNSLPTQPQ